MWKPQRGKWWRTQARTCWGRNPVPLRHSSKGSDRWVGEWNMSSIVKSTTFTQDWSISSYVSVLDLPDLAWPLDPAHCVPVDIHSCPRSRISHQNSHNAGEFSIWLSLVFQMYQKALDESTQYTKGRWIAFVVLNLCFLLRIVLKQACFVFQTPSFWWSSIVSILIWILQ